MSRTTGTYTAPANSWNPAVEGTPVDETDWNTTLTDIEAALTESVYTGGLGSTDNRLVRTDGTDTKKAQGSAVTVDDSGNMSGVATLTATTLAPTTIELGASDTTLARSGAGDVTIEGNAIYRVGGTDVALADGGTGASLSDPGADRIMAWDDSAGAVKFLPLADLTAEAAPATGDVVLIYGAEGDLRAVDWSNLPGASAGIASILEDTTPQLGGDLDANAFNIGFDDATGIEDDSGNEQLIFQKTASAVNQWEMTNAATGGKPVLAATGDDTNIIARINGKGTGGVEIKGTTTNDNASTGYVGQVLSSTVAEGSAVSLTTVTEANMTSLSITPGDWDVWIVGNFVGLGAGGSGCTNFVYSLSTTSATRDVSAQSMINCASFSLGTSYMSCNLPSIRVSVAANTTYYAVTRATFTSGVGTVGAFGTLYARRRR